MNFSIIQQSLIHHHYSIPRSEYLLLLLQYQSGLFVRAKVVVAVAVVGQLKEVYESNHYIAS